MDFLFLFSAIFSYARLIYYKAFRYFAKTDDQKSDGILEESSSIPLKRQPVSEPGSLTTSEKCKKEFLEAVTMIQTKNMLMASLTFIYSGFVLAYWSGVYSSIVTCKHINYTSSDALEEFRSHGSERLAGVNGIMMGLGQVVGGLLFAMTPAIAKRFTKHQIVLYKVR